MASASPSTSSPSTIAAYGIGAPLIGRVNDALGAGTNPQMMRYGMLLCPLASALAALLLWRGSRKLEQEK